VIFDHWADGPHTAYVGYELTPDGVRHQQIPYPRPGDGGARQALTPYRYDGLQGF
jgi:hypothetical protein